MGVQVQEVDVIAQGVVLLSAEVFGNIPGGSGLSSMERVVKSRSPVISSGLGGWMMRSLVFPADGGQARRVSLYSSILQWLRPLDDEESCLPGGWKMSLWNSA